MAQKRKMADFRIKSHIACRMSSVVSLFENCQQQSCREFIGLTIRAKMIGGKRLILSEILGRTDRVGAKSPIFDLFSPVGPRP